MNRTPCSASNVFCCDVVDSLAYTIPSAQCIAGSLLGQVLRSYPEYLAFHQSLLQGIFSDTLNNHI